MKGTQRSIGSIMAFVVLMAIDAALFRSMTGLDLAGSDPYDLGLTQGVRYARMYGTGIVFPVVNILAIGLLRSMSRNFRMTSFLVASQVVGWSAVMAVLILSRLSPLDTFRYPFAEGCEQIEGLVSGLVGPFLERILSGITAGTPRSVVVLYQGIGMILATCPLSVPLVVMTLISGVVARRVVPAAADGPALLSAKAADPV